jgi:hypothetical protein
MSGVEVDVLTGDFLNPGENPSVGDTDVDGGRKSAVEARRHDEVLLEVVAASVSRHMFQQKLSVWYRVARWCICRPTIPI